MDFDAAVDVDAARRVADWLADALAEVSGSARVATAVESGGEEFSMSRQDKELRTRWSIETTASVIGALSRGRAESPYPDYQGRVDLSYATLPEFRLLESEFTNCVFDQARSPSLRTYSARLSGCSFVSADLRRAQLGARVEARKPGSQYIGCDFQDANLRNVSTDPGSFVDCNFKATKWKGTQTLSTVFEGCNFQDSIIEEVELFPSRCRQALSRLRSMPGQDARAAEEVLRIEADEADLLPDDSIGILALDSYPGGLRDAISAAFDLTHS
ncbi:MULTISPECIES: pentapeptide repeat-containing protein [Mycobacterium]|nr:MULTISPECIES: hypothetical protein [Mycobacterium]